MQTNKIFGWILLGISGYMILRGFQTQQKPPAVANETTSHFSPVIEDVLKEHQGEESPIVKAFETALEEDRNHEVQLAAEVGVQA